MDQYKEEFIQFMVDCQVLKFGEFILKSGRKSPFFMNAGAYVTGNIANQKEKPGYGRLLAANFLGLGIVYLFGMVYYYLMSNFYLGNPIGLWPLFLYCFLLAVPGDIALCILGAILGKRLIPLVRERGRVTYEQT